MISKVNKRCKEKQQNFNNTILYLVLLSRIIQNASNTTSDILKHFNMQKLIRSMRIALWSQNASNHKLSFRIFFAQKSHKRNRTSFSKRHSRLAKIGRTVLIDRLFQPFGQKRRRPAIRRFLFFENDFRSYIAIILCLIKKSA